MLKRFFFVNALWGVVLLLASCAPADAPAPTPPPQPTKAPAAEPTAKPAGQPTVKPAAPAATPQTTPSKAAPRYGGTLNIASYDSFGHYDIHQNSITAGLLPFQHAYNNIVQYHPTETEKIIGDLADSWDVSGDGTVYTFRLRKGVKWHDGKPFTSADAKFTLDRMSNPPKGTLVPKVGELMGAIKQAETPDPDTLKVTLKYASASFIPGLATTWCPVFPKHVIEEKGDMKRTIMGTGPFRFKSELPDNFFELTKNKEYFKEGRPYVDGVRYYIIKDATTRFAAFRTKRIQMTWTSYGFNPSQLEQVKREMPDVTAVQLEGATFIGYYFLVDRQPWGDLRVRKALSLAIDRQEAVRSVEEGIGSVAGAMPPGPWGLPQDEVLKLPGYRQPKDEDRAEAKRLLAEAGQSNLKFTMLVRAGRTYESAAEFFKDQMSKIGVDVTLKPMEYTSLYALVERHDYDTVQMKLAWTLYDPDDILLQYYRSKAVRNYGNFSDPEIDSLIGEQAKTLDQGKRKEIVLKLQRTIMEKVPFVQSHWGNYVMGWWKDVQNFAKPLFQYTYWRMEDVWLAQ